MLKRCIMLLLCVSAVASSNGCSSLNHQENGAIEGGLIGAGIGALAGGRKHALVGAAAGGAIGTGVGAIAGANADAEEKRQKEAAVAAAAPVRGPVTLDDIIKMSASGVSDMVIINQIRSSGTRYNLDGATIIMLQQNGVKDSVITEMQNTRYRGRPFVVSDGPVIYERPVYVAPPPTVGIGFGYTRIR